jgi:Integrase core domain/Homeodomain-like domain
VVAQIEQLRRQRWTGKQIAAETGVSPATVSRVLRRLGLNKLSALEPAEPVRRYEREKPGELIHLDIKKLGRIGSVGHRITGRYPGAVNRHHGIGWEFVHVCIDDASRIAFVQVLADQRKESAVAFLEAAVAHFAKLGSHQLFLGYLNLCFCSAASSSALFAFWRQLTSRLRYNHASIAKVSLLLTSTTSAVVATRADTCRTSNSIMSSLSAIFSVPVTSTTLFMVLLLLHYAMLVVTSNTSPLDVWS